uniref:LETM1 domain-containing protein n=1 Tax=Steinernema glaseri TaxID=37863 RepID=A0A1I7Y8I5_9BILA
MCDLECKDFARSRSSIFVLDRLVPVLPRSASFILSNGTCNKRFARFVLFAMFVSPDVASRFPWARSPDPTGPSGAGFLQGGPPNMLPTCVDLRDPLRRIFIFHSSRTWVFDGMTLYANYTAASTNTLKEEEIAYNINSRTNIVSRDEPSRTGVQKAKDFLLHAVAIGKRIKNPLVIIAAPLVLLPLLVSEKPFFVSRVISSTKCTVSLIDQIRIGVKVWDQA